MIIDCHKSNANSDKQQTSSQQEPSLRFADPRYNLLKHFITLSFAYCITDHYNNGSMEGGCVLSVTLDLSNFGSFCCKILLFLPIWWNKYYFTWRRCLLQREFYMFIIVCNKSLWEICLPGAKKFFMFIVMCGDVKKCPGPTESNIQDLFNQKGLKVLHQNIWGLFHNIAILFTFPDTHKNTHIFSQWYTHQ